MHKVDLEGMAQSMLEGDTSSGRREQAMAVEERLRCMYCRRMVYKKDLERVPPELGKLRNVARMACPGCIKTIKDKRKAARKAIRKMLIRGGGDG